MRQYSILIFLAAINVQLAMFADNARDWCLWIPGMAICAVGLLAERRTYLSGGTLFWIVCLILYVVAPASQLHGSYFQAPISVTGIPFPDDVVLRSVAIGDAFLAVALGVQLIMRRGGVAIDRVAVVAIARAPDRQPAPITFSAQPISAELAIRAPSEPEREGSSEDQQLFVMIDDAAEYRNMRTCEFEEGHDQTGNAVATAHPIADLGRIDDPIVELLQSRLFASAMLCGSFAMVVAVFMLTGGLNFIVDGRAYAFRAFADNPALGTFTNSLIQDLQVVLVLLGIERYLRRRTHGNLALLTVLIGIALMLVNPFNTARYQIGAVVVMAMLFSFRGRIPVAISYIGIGLYMFVIMPMMNMLRYGATGPQAGKLAFGIDYNSLDYDCFSMFTFAIYRTGINGFAYGKYMLSSALFFLPRSWWPDKPRPSANDLGEYLMRHHSGWFDNLSCPPMGDGYMDFGLAGVLLMGASFAYLVERSDRVIDRWPQASFLSRGMAAAMVSFLPILLRGSLGAVAGFVVAPIVVLLAVRMIAGAVRELSGTPARAALIGQAIRFPPDGVTTAMHRVRNTGPPAHSN